MKTNLKFELSGFKGNLTTINGTHRMKVSRLRLLRAAISFGTPIWAAMSRNAAQALSLALHKATALSLALEFTNTNLSLPIDYHDLDKSEKINISYWTGMTFATLAANQYLGIAQLLHAEALKKKGFIVTKPNSRQLADFVGKNPSGNWHVVEAKARASKPTKQERKDWKKQAGSITLIHGQIPQSSSFCVTRVQREYSVELCDPTPKRDDIIVEFMEDYSAVQKWYYEPYVQLLTRASIKYVVDDRPYRVRLMTYDPLYDDYIYVGLAESILSGTREEIEPQHKGKDTEEANVCVGVDGVIVSASKSTSMESR